MSNTPEFGAGANTFNEVFGATRNPWNTSRSAAGSSGGAAVALATGTAWLAHGSDMGGSLRNPASFNGIVGFRPSVGRVARTPEGAVDQNLSQQGPMARNVEDVALLLDAMVGEDPRDPLSLPRTGESYLAAARGNWRPKRVAWSADLGITKVDSEVAAITAKAARRFAELGVVVEEAHPDLTGLHECFQTLRAYDFFMKKAKLLRSNRDLLKPEVIWNIEKGYKIDFNELEAAENQRVSLARRYLAFFDKYDLLLTPATVVAPYPDREPLRGRGERPQVRELCGMAGDRLRDHGAMRRCAVIAVRVHQREAACRPADRRSAAQRGAHSRCREGAGGRARHERHDADRSARDALGRARRRRDS